MKVRDGPIVQTRGFPKASIVLGALAMNGASEIMQKLYVRRSGFFNLIWACERRAAILLQCPSNANPRATKEDKHTCNYDEQHENLGIC